MKIDNFNPQQKKLFSGLAQAATTEQVYLVGGAVRDILLGRECTDIDFIVLPELESLLSRLQQNWKVYFSDLPAPKERVHFKKYGTAKLIFAAILPTGGHLLEFAAARKEHYPAPGAEPVVQRGSLEEDLLRRDFSVNALAVPLNGEAPGEVVDVCNGLQDLQAGVLRVLHDQSFLDDPMRVLRGIRLAVRLQFKFAEDTQRLLAEAITSSALRTVRPQRRFEELRKILHEECWWEILTRMTELDCLRGLFSVLRQGSTKVESADWVERLVSLCPQRESLDSLLAEAGIAHSGKFHEAWDRCIVK